MDNKLSLDSYKKDNINQSQIDFIYNPVHNQHNTLQNQVIKSMASTFTGENLLCIRRALFK